MAEKADVLVQRARAGDMEAFTALFESFREMVFRISCRLVGETDAEDVVMETYLKAWQAMPQFHGRASLKTWMYRIAYNVSVDLLRSRERRNKRFVSVSEGEGEPAQDVADTGQTAVPEQMERQEDAVTVRQAMEKLPPEHRGALMMRFADDMSYAEIAAATGVSIGTVMSRLFYGKRKLKALLKEWQASEEG
jgi:RNA polymerase sigma-70 factor, ECF subfamily